LNRKKESEMFNKMAGYYDDYRPGYPAEIIQSIVKKASLSIDSKMLEIGAGSGKATEQFADLGFEILCIEPGKELAEKGNEKFVDKNIKFVVSRFEDYPVPAKYFDVVISAQAFHWVPKPQGFQKSSSTLKKNGVLALFWNIELLQDTELDYELLTLMEKFNAFTSTIPENDYEKRVMTISNEIIDSKLFTQPEIIHARWERNYTATEYFGFVSTGNMFIQNSDEVKDACYKELVKLVEKHGGIKRQYICELYLSRKI